MLLLEKNQRERGKKRRKERKDRQKVLLVDHARERDGKAAKQFRVQEKTNRCLFRELSLVEEKEGKKTKMVAEERRGFSLKAFELIVAFVSF